MIRVPKHVLSLATVGKRAYKRAYSLAQIVKYSRADPWSVSYKNVCDARIFRNVLPAPQYCDPQRGEIKTIKEISDNKDGTFSFVMMNCAKRAKACETNKFKGPLKGVILDWSGTLVDPYSMSMIDAANSVCDRYNMQIPDKTLREKIGMCLLPWVEDFMNSNVFMSQWNSKMVIPLRLKCHDMISHCEIFHACIEQEILQNLREKKYTTLLPGVKNAFDYMKKTDIKIGTTSGFTGEMLKCISLDAKKQGFVPDLIVASDNVNIKRYRPHYDGINYIANRLSFPHMGSIVKIGNTIEDVEEALNAGIMSISVVNFSSEMAMYSGYSGSDKIKEIANKFFNAGSSYVVGDFRDIEFTLRDVSYHMEKGLK